MPTTQPRISAVVERPLYEAGERGGEAEMKHIPKLNAKLVIVPHDGGTSPRNPY